ncbi:MAG: efflux RND transporter periplasmic adaptor subunit [Pirellulaceae bacterium]
MTGSKQVPSKKTIHWSHLIEGSGKLLIGVVGSIGVIYLLMLLAGVFTEKVAEGDSHLTKRQLPSNARVGVVQEVTSPRFESAVGAIEPIHESSVASKILARVDEVTVSAGQYVNAGEVLVRLNNDDLQARLKQAEAQRNVAAAQVQQAAADLSRAKQLISSRAISTAELESATTAEKTSQAELDRAERAVEEANILLEYSTINAPFSGVVIEKNVQAGDTVIPGQTLLTLYDPDQMQLVANVRESLAIGLKIGQQLPAKLETLDHECLATVREVVPQADVGSRSFQVKVSGPCPPGIYSGMFGRLMLPLEDETIRIIPREAVRRVGQLTFVDVVEGDTVTRRNVQIGRIFDQDVEVLSGLAVDEQVLLSNSTDEEASR